VSINVEKNIKHWHKGVSGSLKSANILLENGRQAEALFFAHLALEKALKALVVKSTKDIRLIRMICLIWRNAPGWNARQKRLSFW